jgi:hypothetical protein
MLAAAVNGLHALGLLDYVLYPIMFLTGLYCTLLGFGVIRAGAPDKGGEAALATRLKLLRWLGPLLMIVR